MTFNKGPTFKPMTQEMFPTYRFLGIAVQPLTKADLLKTIESIVLSNDHNCIIGNHNLHSLYLFHHDSDMREFYEASTYTHADGISLILLAKLFELPLRRIHRNTYLDWIEDFFAMAEQKSWRIYFLGGPPSMVDRVPARLHSQFPGLQVRCHQGFDAFDPDTEVWKEIEEFSPHVILAGMGMPIQERWIMQARSRVNTHLFLPCGAAIEYFLRIQRPPPRWIGQLGMEWLYRLITRPRKLFRRYLIEPLVLLPMVLRELTKDRADADK
jgi:N-acetylglucosaminyldiphosphoundecaprenol N-acetyl-beta-D-mannosaminyltransferase